MNMFKNKLCLALAAAGVSLMAAVAQPAWAVTFTTFTNPHPTVGGGTIGFAYAGNKFVGSVQQDGYGALYSTDLSGGSVALFAPTVFLASSPASEHYVASSLGLGGFASRDIYVAASNSIVHISNDGTTSSTFVSGLNGAVRGILFDAVGTFGNNMLVTTNSGSVYKVNSSGVATLLANLGEDTEGLDVAPLGAGFGTFDGQLIVASEVSGNIRAISKTGIVSNITLIGGGPEELSFVPLNLGASGNPVEGFYGADYTPDVIKAGVSQFTGMLGDVIVTSEISHAVSGIHWNGSSFVVSSLGSFPNQPEDGIFVTADIVKAQGGTVPEPSTLLLLGSGMAGFAITRIRKFRRNA